MATVQRVNPEVADDEQPVDEGALVARLRAGDGRAFEILVREHGGRLLGVTRRLLHQEEDARDCVQETFLQAYRQIDQFESRSALGTWLHRIAVNQALGKLRKRSSRAEEPLDESEDRFDAYGIRIEPMWQFDEPVDRMLEVESIRLEVRARIDSLPEAYRTVLLLRDIEGMSTREVADALGASEGAIKVRLHRARSALKRRLEPFWREVQR